MRFQIYLGSLKYFSLFLTVHLRFSRVQSIIFNRCFSVHFDKYNKGSPLDPLSAISGHLRKMCFMITRVFTKYFLCHGACGVNTKCVILNKLTYSKLVPSLKLYYLLQRNQNTYWAMKAETKWWLIDSHTRSHTAHTHTYT